MQLREFGIEVEKIIPVGLYEPEIEQEKGELLSLSNRAIEELSFYSWCEKIEEVYLGIYTPEIMGVFLVQFQTSDPRVDPLLWVVVGDLPFAYLVCDNAPNAASAVSGYIQEMKLWVEAAKSGESVVDLIPVNLPATMENAKKLEWRLSLLEEYVLGDYADDLKR
jgi:hypothetical protein